MGVHRTIASVPEWSPADLNGNCCGQIKVIFTITNNNGFSGDDDTATIPLFAIGRTDTTSRLFSVCARGNVLLGGRGFRIRYQFSGLVASTIDLFNINIIGSVGGTPEEEWDVRWRWSTTTGMKLWVSGPAGDFEVEDPGATGNFNTLPDVMWMGTQNHYPSAGGGSSLSTSGRGGTSAGGGSGTSMYVKMVRIRRDVLTDAEIEAWE